ncbi:LysR family transcriptional regulator (plasmid) [Acidovorax sp. DW039]|uniref:LysR family transcriptional regulator n=1 Tax=Acidovorax sp. DW039 TaxID=3095606 RepID=UPI003088458C|nr:LysR family transcriptional regulator [Acidovorax sp. DW039]
MQLRQLDLNLLKAFDALMDERNVTRAAERLAVTQPAVSATLNRLREALGDPLFVRTQRGITPTERALALSAPIKRILADIEAVLQPQAFDPGTAKFTVTVSATDYALRAVVMPFIAELRPLAPNVRVAVIQAHGPELLDRMERGELDLALITPQMAPPDVHVRPLFDERYVCVLREGHPAAAQDALTLDTFCELDHGIVSLQGGGFSGPTDDALARLGLQRQVKVSVPSFGMLLDLVRSTNLAALVPERLLVGVTGLTVRVPPLDVAGFTKVLAWHARTHADLRQRWVRDLLIRTCSLPTPQSGI